MYSLVSREQVRRSTTLSISSMVFPFSLNYNLLLSDQFVTELLQIGAVGYPMIINSSWWYISTMLIAMSALFPLACKYKDGYGKYIAPLILIFILAIVRAKNININDPVNRAYIFCNGMYKALIFIILGNICFELSKKIKGINFNRFGIFILSIIEIVGWCVSVANLHYSKIGLIIHAIILTWNVALTFSGKTLSSKLFRWNIWKKIGNYGFYLYLCQVSVRAYVTRCYTGDYMMLLKKYVTVSLVTASIIYFIIEVIYKYIKKIYIWRMLRFMLIKKDDAKQDIEP